ncbi:potassium channel family protein [Fictibacillus terranigra]|uniref:Potassium channel family protein n=1 Tax=Fictibacillus terranigra TaxID=3058424 RepID=A0ABT8E3C8_9BACL|nr:potassium channel family protein [Fictibacillus sp. CENA-BCM004]MDN4072409.1 potassium channel family protein [Fictibacillus sp. CENA-BCM004]
MKFEEFFFSYLRLPMLIRLFSIIGSLMILFGVLIHFLEPKNFPTVFVGIYWAVMTAATVGFGDFVPRSFSGRFIAILLVFLGGSFIAFFTVNAASAVIKSQNKYKEGKLMFNGTGHLCIVGWNERAKQTISTLSQEQDSFTIMIIDSSLNENPLSDQGVFFIKGSPAKDETWEKANIKEAKAVLLTADQNMKEAEADMHTILSIITVKGLNPSVHVMAEILTPEQHNNSMRAGADELINTTNLASDCMAQISFQSMRKG